MTDATNLHALPQGFPTKPVRLIEPFGAGGGPDLLAHALAQKLVCGLESRGVCGEPLPVREPRRAPPRSPVASRRLHIAPEHQRPSIQRSAFKEAAV